jgi:hypothetical protein
MTKQAVVSAYNPAVFGQLNQFHIARKLLAERRDRILCVGNVFVRHRLHKKFGLSLLHKHFDLTDDEIIVRKVNVKRRIVNMFPKKDQKDAVAYLWRASPAKPNGWEFFPLEFLGTATEKTASPGTMDELAPFFHDLAETLADLDLLDVFGVGTTNIRDVQIAENEIMIETTDEAKRRLTVKPYLQSDVKMENLTETFWMFRPEEYSNELEAALECKGQHCNRHCTSHCRGQSYAGNWVMTG